MSLPWSQYYSFSISFLPKEDPSFLLSPETHVPSWFTPSHISGLLIPLYGGSDTKEWSNYSDFSVFSCLV